MNKILIILLLSVSSISAQSVADFENYILTPESYLKDASPESGFTSGHVFLPNEYTDAGSFDFWSGWVVSNLTDTISQGFLNEGSTFAGSGNNGSENFAVCYAGFPVNMHFTIEDAYPRHMYISNTSYAALSMRFGDSIAKKFGGTDGSDPDSLVVSIHAWDDGMLKEDSINVVLADFRFEDNSLDYILKDWIKVDLSNLGSVDSLRFTMYSSDTGDFGINTPAYFCVDDIQVDMIQNTIDNDLLQSLSIYPNPCTDQINFTDHLDGPYSIFDIAGSKVQSGRINGNKLDVGQLKQGSYLIHIDGFEGLYRFVKL